MNTEIKTAIKEMLDENKDIKTIYFGTVDCDKVQHAWFPIAIIGEPDQEVAKKRFLFSAKESNFTITVGAISNDKDAGKAKCVALKDSIRATLKADPLLKGAVTYSTMIKSRHIKLAEHPHYFMELTFYIRHKD